jgi:hypothetical protein
VNWVSEEARERSAGRGSAPETTAEQIFDQAVARRWHELLDELRGDVDEFNAQGGSAQFGQNYDIDAAIDCATTRITLKLNLDVSDRTIRYDYLSSETRVAAPEGGILTLRLSRYRRAKLYSSDEHLTSEEARRLLLEPVFFPPGEQTVAA